MIDAIIFDFDGVIHDTFNLSYEINKKFNPKITLDEYRDLFNGNLYDNIKESSIQINEFFEIQEKEFEYLFIDEEIKKELLKLKERYNLFIITSNKESTLKKYFQRNKLQNLFDDILGMEMHKSKVEKFKILFKKYSLKNEKVVFITDTLGDLLEANKLGLKSIALNSGFHETQRLIKGKPYKIISHIKEIEETI